MTATLLPPPLDSCPVCASQHEANAPHNAQSIYYRFRFWGLRGRWPTWADAIAHCTPDAQVILRKELEKRGAWTEPESGDPIADPLAESINQPIRLPVAVATPADEELLAAIKNIQPHFAQFAEMGECKKTSRVAVLLDYRFAYVTTGVITGCPTDCHPACREVKDFPGGDGCVHAEQNAVRKGGDRATDGYIIHAKLDENGELVPSGRRFCPICTPELRAAKVQYLVLFHEDGWFAYRIADLPGPVVP